MSRASPGRDTWQHAVWMAQWTTHRRLVLTSVLASAAAQSTTNSSSSASTCKDLPAWGFGVGIGMSVAGSIGINIGQNLQAAGISHLPEAERSQPFKSARWRFGMSLFIGFSILNFAALALAPSSVLTPIESIQFVTNIFYNKFVNKSVIRPRMVWGVCFALLGTILSVVFGAQGGACSSIEELEGFWRQPAWLTYFALSLLLAAAALAVHVRYSRAIKRGEIPWQHKIVLPVMFTVSSALAGGAQSA